MSAPIAVRPDVLEGIRARWPELAGPWSASVVAELHELCQRYDAKPVGVLPARFGFIVKAMTPDGALALRSSPDPDGRSQGVVAAALADLGVSPRIHEFTVTSHGSWTVMDFIAPGTPLGDHTVMPEPDHIAAMLGPLISQPAPDLGLPNLIDWLRARLTDDQLQDLAPGRQVAPPDERRSALALLEELAADHVPGLCHADASPWNVLIGPAGRLYLIDPRGITGEVAYDVAIIALKAERFVPATSSGAALAAAMSLPADRIHAWVRIARAARV